MALFDRGNLVTTADGYKALGKINNDVKLVKWMTQVQYDALKVKDRTTLYVIVEA